jgi:hypothetical protein
LQSFIELFLGSDLKFDGRRKYKFFMSKIYFCHPLDLPSGAATPIPPSYTPGPMNPAMFLEGAAKLSWEATCVSEDYVLRGEVITSKIGDRRKFAEQHSFMLKGGNFTAVCAKITSVILMKLDHYVRQHFSGMVSNSPNYLEAH